VTVADDDGIGRRVDGSWLVSKLPHSGTHPRHNSIACNKKVDLKYTKMYNLAPNNISQYSGMWLEEFLQNSTM